MPVAISVLLLVTTLAGAGVVAAGHASSATTRDTDRKLALAAAEAGVDVAIYRIDNLKPSTTSGALQCVNTGVATPSSGAGGLCYDSSSSVTPTGNANDTSANLGNGTSYSFQTTTQGLASTCNGTTLGSTQFCITAQGTANGVSRTVQVPVAAGASATQVFPIIGMMGFNGLWLGTSEGTAQLLTDLVSNVEVSTGASDNYANSSAPPSVILGGTTTPPGCYDGASSNVCGHPALIRQSNAFPSPTGPANPGVAKSTNDNGTISCGSWDSTNMYLNIGTSSSCTLGTAAAAYTFYMCRVDIGANANLRVFSGAQVTVYLDSPTRNGTACTNNTSANGWKQDGMWNQNDGGDSNGVNVGGTPSHFTLYMAGNNYTAPNGPAGSTSYTNGYNWQNCINSSDSHTGVTRYTPSGCDFSSSNTRFDGGIYAPSSGIYIGATSIFKGAWAGAYMDLEASNTYQSDNSETNITWLSGGGGAATRSPGWHECQDPTVWPETAYWVC